MGARAVGAQVPAPQVPRVLPSPGARSAARGRPSLQRPRAGGRGRIGGEGPVPPGPGPGPAPAALTYLCTSVRTRVQSMAPPAAPARSAPPSPARRAHGPGPECGRAPRPGHGLGAPGGAGGGRGPSALMPGPARGGRLGGGRSATGARVPRPRRWGCGLGGAAAGAPAAALLLGSSSPLRGSARLCSAPGLRPPPSQPGLRQAGPRAHVTSACEHAPRGPRPAARAPAPLPRPGALVPARPGPAPSRPAPWRRAAEGTRGRRAGRGSLLLPPPGRGCGPRSRGLDGGPWASGPGSGLKRVSPREGPRAGARSRGVGEGAGSGWAGDQLNPACVSLVLHGPTRGPPAWQVRGRRGGPRGAAQSRAAPLRRGEGKLSVSHLGSPLPSETPPAPSPGAPGPRTPELRQSQALVIRRG